ncbi:hypothetical protein RJT34_00102 [Clitoria ternatea]|uniref:Uncharacterized protein n=1 Tax=Clitoria ternatea TaxID=43366 RepID=A0AAN9PXV1_CLITE
MFIGFRLVNFLALHSNIGRVTWYYTIKRILPKLKLSSRVIVFPFISFLCLQPICCNLLLLSFCIGILHHFTHIFKLFQVNIYYSLDINLNPYHDIVI